ncbi:MAG TPA: DNA polymerase IV [Polyangiaceae bacterium]|jgi:DNA polymerase-4|nr:DNA polymerase IV [Polyangiaceae bacterium]
MALAAPRICCLDLDTFFVSVERLLDPRLEGKPVIVGGLPGQRGVVTAASYEVRALGVRSGMSLTQAVALAPHAIYLPTRHGVYGDYSARVRAIAENYTPVSQVASIDEMFLDFSGCEGLYFAEGDRDPDFTIERVVRKLTDEIKAQVGLPASCGIATSRSVAKVASGLAKPRGVLMVRAGNELAVLGPLPVRKFPGIGPVAEQKLNAAGLVTLAELVAAPLPRLRKIFGAWAEPIQRACRGQGAHELGPERPAFLEYDPSGSSGGTISNERTFREDVRDPACIESMLCSLCERVCWRARKRGVKARTVSLKLRYADFETLQRSRTITATCSELELYPVVRDIYDRARTRRTAIRLLGICLSNLRRSDEQLALFDTGEPLHRAVDGIRERYGYGALRIALAGSNE